MKRRPRVRWYPYTMLVSGVAFLLLATAQAFFSVAPGPSYLSGFARGIYGTNNIGSGFAICLFVGIVLAAIGVYALSHHKD